MIYKNTVHSFSHESITPEEYSRLCPNRHVDLVSTLKKVNTDTEFKGHGVRVYRTDKSSTGELFAHNTFDILYSACSDVQMTVCGDPINLAKHNIVIVAPGVPYRISADDSTVVPVISVEKHMIITHFHRISEYDGILARFIANVMWGESSSGYLHYIKLVNPAIHSLIHMLVTEEPVNITGSASIKSQLLMCILGYLAIQHPSTYKASPGKITKSEQIPKILTFIQDNYRTITLERLAENFHYTVPYVSKLVRSATGLTFTEILREIKFDVCRSLLLNSDLKINKIAEIAGFQNTDHFNRLFKKRMGETPTEYKKAASAAKN